MGLLPLLRLDRSEKDKEVVMGGEKKGQGMDNYPGWPQSWVPNVAHLRYMY